MAECVLITEPEYVKAKECFDTAEGLDIHCAPFEESVLAEEVRNTGCRAVIIGVEKYTGPLYDALFESAGSNGAILARFGVGHDGVDKELARAKNIVVTNTPGVLDASVAEHAIWLMGACARNIATFNEEMRKQQFAPRSGIELAGKTLVILGFGPIGRRVAKIASYGFGMSVVVVDILTKEQLETNLGMPFEEIAREQGLSNYVNNADDVLPRVDVVSVHLPAVDATRHFINAERLMKLKSGTILINTARGSLVDESALYDALETGSLAAAGIDVFEHEPYVPIAPDKDLRTLPNVVLTPHVGSNTTESNARMAEMCLTNIQHFFAKQSEQMTTVQALSDTVYGPNIQLRRK